jgi:hypothetical protein
MASATPEKTRRRLLRLLLSRGLVMAPADHRTLRDLEHRQHVRAQPIYNSRGQLLKARAWSITARGQAWVQAQPEPADARQIDIEDAIASSSSGDAPGCAPLPGNDAPTVPAAGVSAPKGRSSKHALTAAKPEIHAS